MSVADFIAERAGFASVTVTIERATRAVDAANTPTETWGAHLSITAVVQVRGGSEALIYGAERGQRFATIYTGPGQDITAGDRVVIGTRTFDITAVRTPDELSSSDDLAYMIIEAVEVLGIAAGP